MKHYEMSQVSIQFWEEHRRRTPFLTTLVVGRLSVDVSDVGVEVPMHFWLGDGNRRIRMSPEVREWPDSHYQIGNLHVYGKLANQLKLEVGLLRHRYYHELREFPPDCVEPASARFND